MAESTQIIEAFDARARRREERRDFFKNAFGALAVGAAGATALSWTSAADAQTIDDAAVLNFALNLEYLEAQFYSYAYSGTGLPENMLGGVTTTGARGNVIIGTTNPARAVNFSGEPIIQQYAREIAADEIAHVAFLRGALGAAAVAQPAINISGDANGPFTAAAKSAGIDLTASNGVFDPYALPDNFLLGAFIFEDVGVTAYKGSSILITNNTFLDAAAGILAVEAFHSGIVRGALYRRGAATPALRTNADKISDARDTVDNTRDDDQGISPVQAPLTSSAGTTTGTASNFVPTDANGICYSRTAQEVLNVVYLNTAAASSASGGFFPAGVNGAIRSSAAK